MKRESVLGRLTPGGVVRVLSACAVGSVVSGCGSGDQIDYAAIQGLGGSGGGTAAVFGLGAVADVGWEQGRRDVTLNAQDNGPRLATDDWSHDPRPSLRLQRRGRFTTRDGRSYLYYESESDRRHW